ncbi:M61 family metallopeptidase [Kineobactrum salinum]|uniref:Uncharacterized protein n=1 Tax=Kineobactrum salinum TaxID=2708301 RepID=A0A6C0U3Q1_9GAMM|nr:hypothetical protein [Kineobactrum salinum]QIB66721.1 hypothetical protein G3T16_16285 [Kineobactrum salinum]
MYRSLTIATLLLLGLLYCASAPAAAFEVLYRAAIQPDTGLAEVEILLRGEQLPSRLVLHLNPERHQNVRSDAGLTRKDDTATWRPRGPEASLRYEFVIDEQKTSGRYDSHITDDWAILRSDKLIPPISARMVKGLEASAELVFKLPRQWSAAAPYALVDDKPLHYRIIDPGRRLPRPKGWLILGDITSRQDIIDGVDVRVAAPSGEGARLQDILAFIAWNLPEVKAVFPDFPEHLLVVLAGEPMWRGGLSGTRSLFMHAQRPLISGNRTSSMIHELVHIGTGIRGAKNSDWIVEGIAEYYASAILYRSGGISETRYRETLDWQANWARRADTLFTQRSSGPVTARAVGVMHHLDEALREATGGEATIDDVALALAQGPSKVSLQRLRDIVAELATDEVDLDAIIAEAEQPD